MPLEFLAADLISASLFSSASAWGIYQAGAPVVTFDTVLSFEFRQGWTISDYPVENGAFASYDKVALPYDARVKFASGGSLANRQALLESIQQIAGDLNLYDVVTPEAIYQNANIQHQDYRRTAQQSAGLLQIEVWLLEIRQTGDASYQTSQQAPTDGTATNADGAQPATFNGPPVTDPKDPSGASPYNGGGVQVIPLPNDTIQNMLTNQLAPAGVLQ